MLKRPTRCHGVSLIELLIGIAIGTIVVSGAFYVLADSARYGVVNLRSAELSQNLRATMALMVNDIRRAGYAAITDPSEVPSNPFLSGSYDIQTGNADGEDPDTCIVLTYNLDEDSPPQVDNFDASSGEKNEKFGFRLHQKAIETRTGVPDTDDAADCELGSWEDLTEEEIEITELTFSLTHTQVEILEDEINNTGSFSGESDDLCSTGNPCLCLRYVEIALTGQLKSASMQDIKQTVRNSVRVRNDKYLNAFDTTTPCRDP